MHMRKHCFHYIKWHPDHFFVFNFCRNEEERRVRLSGWSYPYLMCEAWWPHGLCTYPWSEWSRYEPWPETLIGVLGQDTSLSQCLSPPRSINGYWQIVGGNLTNCRGVTCNGLASCPGEVEILLATSCYRNLDKLWQLWASLGSKASHSLSILLWILSSLAMCGCNKKAFRLKIRKNSSNTKIIFQKKS